MTTNPPFLAPHLSEDFHQLHRCWIWFLILGVALMAIGFFAIGSPAVATLTTVEVFGFFLLMAGVVEVASAIWARGSGGFFQHLLSGLLYLFLGLVMAERPGLGAAGWTLVIAVFLVASGLFRIVFALGHRYTGRVWTFLSGGISVILGLMIWRDLPEATLWVIGTFVGIELIFNGLSWLMLGLAARTMKPSI